MSTALRYDDELDSSGQDSGDTPEQRPETGQLVEQPHGGKLWRGRPANPVAGPGRPKDAVRAKLLELGAEKSIPFLSDLLDGRVTVDLIGKCGGCGAEEKMSMEWVEQFVNVYRTSADLRLKASEQTLKYGLGQQKDVSVEAVREKVERTLAVIHELAPPDVAASIIAALRPVWT